MAGAAHDHIENLLLENVRHGSANEACRVGDGAGSFADAETRKQLVQHALVVDAPADPPQRIQRAAQIRRHQFVRGRPRIAEFLLRKRQTTRGFREIGRVARIDRDEVVAYRKSFSVDEFGNLSLLSERAALGDFLNRNMEHLAC